MNSLRAITIALITVDLVSTSCGNDGDLASELEHAATTGGLAIADLIDQGPPPQLTVVRFGHYYPIKVAFPGPFEVAAFSPSGKRLATLDFVSKLRILDTAGNEIASL